MEIDMILLIGFGGTVQYGYKIFRCKKCGKKWKISEPDNAYRVYLNRLYD